MKRHPARAKRRGQLVGMAFALATALLLKPPPGVAAEFSGSGTYHIPPAIAPTLVERDSALDSLTGVILRDSSTLVVNDGGAIRLQGIYPGYFETKGVDAADQAHVTFAAGSSFEFDGWTSDVYVADLVGQASAEFLPGSTITIDGHGSEVIAFDLAEDASLHYAGDATITVDGIAPVRFVRVVDRAHVELAGNVTVLEDANSAITGVWADGLASVRAGGSLHLVDHGNGFALGLRARGASSVDADAVFRLQEFGNSDAIGFWAEGDSRVAFSGAIELEEEGNGDVVGFRAAGSAAVRFTGQVAGREHGNGTASGFIAEGTSQVLSSGAIHVEINGNGPAYGFRAAGNAKVGITGGVIDVSLPGYPGEAPLMFTAANAASVEIFGGEFVLNPLAPTPRFSASDESIVRFYGTSFNYPFGPIADLQGALRGVLGDGAVLDLQFSRGTAARIELVRIPEPAAMPLVVTAICGASLTRQRWRLALRLRPA